MTLKEKKTEISDLVKEVGKAKKDCEDEENLEKLENLCKAVESNEDGSCRETLQKQKAEADADIGFS